MSWPRLPSSFVPIAVLTGQSLYCGASAASEGWTPMAGESKAMADDKSEPGKRIRQRNGRGSASARTPGRKRSWRRPSRNSRRRAYAGTKVEDVAARARVSKGLPYLYFKTKEELFKAVVRSVITSHFDVIRERMETTELSVEAFLKGPFLAFIQELVGSQARLHRAAPDRRRAQASRAHRLLLRARSSRAASRP